MINLSNPYNLSANRLEIFGSADFQKLGMFAKVLYNDREHIFKEKYHETRKHSSSPSRYGRVKSIQR